MEEPKELVVDGVKTNLPPEALADMPKSEETPPKEEKPTLEPEPEKKPEEAPAKPEAETKPKEEEAPLPEARSKKATPFAKLLEKKHTLETTLAEKEQAIADMQSQIEKLSQKPDNLKTDDEIAKLSEESGVDQDFISKVVTLARKGLNPDLPKEVKDIIAERQLQKDLQVEEAAFNTRLGNLAKVFSNEPIAEHKEKIQELAYSDQLAPDGEPYSSKELSEIYFGFIKPEVEPGRKSGESADIKGGGAKETILDFQEIFERDDPRDVQSMDDKTFKEYGKWMEAKGNKSGATIQRY